jgi:ribosome-associated translation inhibitor RaiA
MAALDFPIEFESEVPHFDEETKQMAENRLMKLAEGHKDMVGAAISVREPAREADPFLYEARVVVYARPEDIAATKQDDTLEGALKAALTAVERQIRQKREKLGEPWKRPDVPGSPEYDL